MADRPILFSGPMVRALLTGTKTQTRRLIKPTSQTDGFTMYPQYLNGERIGSSSDPSFYDLSEFAADPSKGLYGSGAPYCPGDRLWVRESIAIMPRTAYALPKTVVPHDPDMSAYYQADFDRSGKPRWRPSIHMPRWASRLTLTVTEVRVQRLQEIGRGDAIAEGLTLASNVIEEFWRWPPPLDANLWLSPIAAYRSLWDSINAGRAPWDSNPWVCAITFKTALGNIDAISEAA